MHARLLFVALCCVSVATPLAAQLRYELGIRVEGHLMPAVSTGPLDPAWSPDGRWLAFSMRGDIWKVPAAGGEAVALTEAPGYHFEPAWAPDGSRIALTVDIDGDLDIGIVSADGGPVRRLTTGPSAEVQPAWHPDGETLFYVSSRDGSLDIHRLELASGATEPVVAGPRDDIQPAVAPDGRRLAYVAPVPGLLGSGGIWVKPLPTGEARLVHYEETSYRAKPTWTADGSALLYASDLGGSNDLAVVPAGGGNRVQLTRDPLDEFGPVMSPDAGRIAFVSNRGGPTALFTIDAGGGADSAWRQVALSSRRSRFPSGRLRGTLVGPDGRPTPGRIQLLAADGRAYTPDGGFHRVTSVSETHYFHTRGSFEVELPAGAATLEALRGFEYRPASATVEVPAGGVVEVRLQPQRLVDAPARGWYSGDNHLHDLHEGRFGLTQEDMFYQVVAEDIHVANPLIHMDGTKLMGRWDDLTGEPYRLSDSRYIMQYGHEFRGSFGHVGLLGVQRFIMPLIGGVASTAYATDVLNAHYLQEAREQGGIGGFMHPYNSVAERPEDAAGEEIPIDVALGLGDFYDVVCVWSDEHASADMYYRLLNSGLRIAATGGTDNFSDVWRDPPPGTGRTYARLDGPLSFASYLDAVRAGRTFGTNGPLLFLEVDGRGPGEEIRVQGRAPTSIEVRVEARSLAPLDRVDVLVNGEVAHSTEPEGDRTRADVAVALTVDGSAWIAARAVGPPHRYVGDSYAFAHTSPVYVTRDGRPFTSPEDARFLLQVIDEIWRRVEERAQWATPEHRQAYQRAVDEARAVYRRIAEEATRR